jgi:hypothetical protein
MLENSPVAPVETVVLIHLEEPLTGRRSGSERLSGRADFTSAKARSAGGPSMYGRLCGVNVCGSVGAGCKYLEHASGERVAIDDCR